MAVFFSKFPNNFLRALRTGSFALRILPLPPPFPPFRSDARFVSGQDGRGGRHYFFRSSPTIPLTAPKATPAIGQTIHDRSQLFAMKLQPR